MKRTNNKTHSDPVDLESLEGMEQLKPSTARRVKRLRVVSDEIDVRALRRERARLLHELRMPEPTREELLELGRASHPYYQRDVESIKRRLAEIDRILRVADGKVNLP